MTTPTTGSLVLDGRVQPMAEHPGWHSALLPSPAVQNHAANLMPLDDGALGCVWFGGTQEGMADISIHFSRLPRGSDRWSDTVKLIDDPTRSEQNPILFPAPDGRLWLIYTSQKGGNQDTAVVRTRTSLDNGATWSAPKEITAQTKKPDWSWYATGPGNGIQLKSGRLVIACDHNRREGNVRFSHVIYSDDHGETWKIERLAP